MTISNYPNGFAQGVAIRGMPLLNLHGGDVFWVDSNNGADTGKGTHNQPFETLDYTVGRCTANRGAKIVIKAKHAETYAAAAALAADIEGIEVICLGEGADRPTFTFSAVDATAVVSAASFTMKNFIVKPSIDSVVSPFVVQASDCTLDFELQDESATVECVRAVLTTAAADRIDLNVRYRGFIAGDACDNAIRLVGVDTARINVDFYGVADVGIVEFHTTACHDIDISGKFYNDGTSLTKNVVDTAGSSTWSCQGWDGNSNANFSGGDNAALATDDVTALATAIGVIDGLHDVPVADAVTNLYMRDVVGIKTDAAAAGAVSNAESLMAYIKQVVTAAIADAAQTLKLDGVTIATAPTAASLASFIASGGTSLGTQLPASFSLLDMGRGKQVSRTAADVFDGSQTPLFTVSGGRVLVKALVGEVSVAAIDAGASNTSLVTNPTVGTDAAMCTVLDINADENGTIYALSGNPADALTGGSGGGASCMDRCFIVPEGTIDLLSAADVGTGGALGAFDIWYIPLDTGATITST